MFEDDAQLERARFGDDSTSAMLVARYGDTVYSIARSMCASSSQADEVTLKTFASAVQGTAFRPLGGSLRTWLCGTAVKIALEQRGSVARSAKDLLQRLESRVEEAGGPAIPAAKWPESYDAVVDPDRLTRALRESLDSLDSRVQAAFVLHDVAELSLEDTARILRTSRRETRGWVHQARLSLHQVLEDYFSAPIG